MLLAVLIKFLYMLQRRSKGGRIVFEVALDYSEQKQGYRDMLRLWVR